MREQTFFDFFDNIEEDICRNCTKEKVEKISSKTGTNGICYIFGEPLKNMTEETKFSFFDTAVLKNALPDFENSSYIYAKRCNTCTATDKTIKNCSYYVFDDLNKITNLKLIVLVGSTANKMFFMNRWKKDVREHNRWVDTFFYDPEYNCSVYSVYSPLFIKQESSKSVKSVFPLLMNNTIHNIINFKPDTNKLQLNDYIKKCVILNKEQSVKYLTELNKHTITIAFDYETTGLFPYKEKHKIFSCAIYDSHNKKSFVFCINKYNKHLLAEIMTNPYIIKIGANIQFEHLWNNIILGVETVQFKHDIIAREHYLDNRAGITSLKFQVYKYLGIPDYDSSIHEYLVAEDCYSLNKIDEAPLDELLIYNGLDSLFTYLIWEKQEEILCGMMD